MTPRAAWAMMAVAPWVGAYALTDEQLDDLFTTAAGIEA